MQSMADEIHHLPSGLSYAVTWTRSYHLPVFFLEYYLSGPGSSNNALLSFKRGHEKTVRRYVPGLLQVIRAFRARYAHNKELTLVPVMRSYQAYIDIDSPEHERLQQFASELGIEAAYGVFSQTLRTEAHKASGYNERFNVVFNSLRCNNPPKNILLIDDMINTGATIEAYHKCAHIKDGAVLGAVTLMKNQVRALLNPKLL